MEKSNATNEILVMISWLPFKQILSSDQFSKLNRALAEFLGGFYLAFKYHVLTEKCSSCKRDAL